MSADLVSARAGADYRLQLRYSDGMEGSVYVGNLLDVSSFAAWRDVRVFVAVCVDDRGAVVWPQCGIRLDPEILYLELEARGGRRAPPSRPVDKDPAFMRFMVRAVGLAADSLQARAIAPISSRRGRR